MEDAIHNSASGASPRTVSSSNGAPSSTIGEKHKQSIKRLSTRNEWVITASKRLEESILPAIDDSSLEGCVDSDSLRHFWQLHDEIEKEANEFDTGELRSLRLLAKAASQKALSAEDTDLIEIVLLTLASLDKLLHLLRQRSKALRLLDSRIAWNRHVSTVEADYAKLLATDLPTFLKKARWTTPKDTKPRLSGVAAISPSKSPASKSPRATSATTQAARQMRSEILSLDIASLTSKIHRLQHVSLLNSGKSLDAMIDNSTTPIPEHFLDKQDDLEGKVKSGIAGLGDFCHELVRQWRGSDEIYWTTYDSEESLDGLLREVREAILKTPSEGLAQDYEARQKAIGETLEKLQDRQLLRLKAPVHSVRVPEQKEENIRLRSRLTERLQHVQRKSQEAKVSVKEYRSAVEALQAGLRYQQELQEMLAALRKADSNTGPLTLDHSCFAAAFSESATTHSQKLAILGDLAKEASTLLTSALAIQQSLQQLSIDPNIRKDIQSCLLALHGKVAESTGFRQVEESKIRLASRARAIDGELQEKVAAAQQNQELLSQRIQSSLWSSRLGGMPESGQASEEEATAEVGAGIHLPSMNTQELLESFDRDIDAASSEVKAAPNNVQAIRDHLFRLAEMYQDEVQKIAQRQSTLAAVQAQRTKVTAVDAEFGEVIGQAGQLQGEIDVAPLISSDLARYKTALSALTERVAILDASLSDPAIFVGARCKTTDGLADALYANDDEIRSFLNDLSLKANAAIGQPRDNLEQFREASEVSARIQLADEGRRQLQQSVNEWLVQADTHSLAINHEKMTAILGEVKELQQSGPQSLSVSTISSRFSTALAEDLQKHRSHLHTLHTTIEGYLENVERAMSEEEAYAAERSRREAEARLEEEKRTKLQAELAEIQERVATHVTAVNAETVVSRNLTEALRSLAWTETSEVNDISILTEATSERSRSASLHRHRQDHHNELVTALRGLQAHKDPHIDEQCPAIISQLETAARASIQADSDLQAALSMAKQKQKDMQLERTLASERAARQAQVERYRSQVQQILNDLSRQDSDIRNLDASITATSSIQDLKALVHRAESLPVPVGLPDIGKDMEELNQHAGVSEALAGFSVTIEEGRSLHTSVVNARQDCIERCRERLAAAVLLEEQEKAEAAAEQAAELARQEALRSEEESRLQAESVQREEVAELLQWAADATAAATLAIHGVDEIVERGSPARRKADPESGYGARELARSFSNKLEGTESELARLVDALQATRANLSDKSMCREVDEAIQLCTRTAGRVRDADSRRVEIAEQETDTLAAPDAPQAASPTAGLSSVTEASSQTLTLEDVFGPQIGLTGKHVTAELADDSVASSLVDLDSSLVDASVASEAQPFHELETLLSELSFDRYLLSKSASLSRLPTVEEAEAVQRQVSLAHMHLDDLQDSSMLSDQAQNETDSRLQALHEQLHQKTEEALAVMALATFSDAATQMDSAISDLLDSLDLKENGDENGGPRTVALVEQAFQRVEFAAKPVLQDARVSRKLAQLEETWHEMQAVANGNGETESSFVSTPSLASKSLSRSSSIASDMSSVSKRSASAGSRLFRPPSTSSLRSHRGTAGSRQPSYALPTSSSLSRIPVSSPRVRADSTPSSRTSRTLSISSILPSPTPQRDGFAVPAKPSLRALGHGRHATQGTQRGSGGLSANFASPAMRRVSSAQSDATPRKISLAESNASDESKSPRSRRVSSIRRSGGAHASDTAARPNAYRPNPKRKLDVAVGRIVNRMNVPVNITAADSYQDNSGKYWIGSPEPKLYFARILRSKTVMLRIGGGWQELGSFLDTHFDSLFSASEHKDGTSPIASILQSHSKESDKQWLSASGLRASLPLRPSLTPRTSSNGSSTFSASRKTSLNHSFSPSTLEDGTPLDLTSLLVKSTSRSPPVAKTKQRSTSAYDARQQKKAAAMPWRV